MCKRALRVASLYLEAQTEQEVLQEKALNDKQIEEAALDALNTLYPSLINNWLRNNSVEEITSIMFPLVQNFGYKSTKNILEKELNNTKSILLKAIEQVAKSENNSIKNRVIDHFRFNPAKQEQDVFDFVRKLLNDSKKI
jgi:hypothetical protein